jgi:TRAP-type C4-dicarboxylate transport system substrate-binding protein
MIHRRIGFAPIVFLLVAAFALPGTTTTTKAEESYTLRIASLAPAGSSWMKVLNAWNKTLQDKTNGRLKMHFYPGGSQGDERDFVRKMRVGQLDGGVVTMTGMSMVVRAMIVLVLPGFLDTYEELDRVRAKMAPQFEAMFEKEGFKLLGWGDAGRNRLFSAKPFRAPSDLKSLRPWVWKDELVFVELYDVIGANAIRLGVRHGFVLGPHRSCASVVHPGEVHDWVELRDHRRRHDHEKGQVRRAPAGPSGGL